MGAAVLMRRTGALGLVATLGMLGASAPPASAQQSALLTRHIRPGRSRRPRRGSHGTDGRGSLPGGPLTSGRRIRRSCCASQPATRFRAHGQAAITGAIPGAAQGVDVASFQHPSGDAINWSRSPRARIRFAAVKATEGTYYTNPFALTDLAAAKAAGLSVGAYAFAIPNGNGGSKSAVAQADHLVSYLGASSRTVPIMLDIEFDPYVNSDHTNQCYGLTQAAMVSWVTAFDTEIHRKTGRLPVIYTPAPWWNSCTGSSTGFSQIPLWIPSYGVTSPGLPAGWGNWSIWQYTSSGTVDGIETTGHTDLDQLNPRVVALLNPGHQHGVLGTTRWAGGSRPSSVFPARRRRSRLAACRPGSRSAPAGWSRAGPTGPGPTGRG